MPLRLLLRHLARLTEYDRATNRVVIEEQFLRAMLTQVALARDDATRELLCALNSNRAQNARMHQFVHEANLQRLLGAHILPRENHVERGLQSHATRQTLRATRARNQTELHFGEREHRLRCVGSNAIRASERELESTAEAGALNRHHNRHAPLLDARHHRVAKGARILRILRRLELKELIDIRAGNKGPGLPGNQHRSLHARILVELLNHRGEFVDHRGRELVDALARQVKG